MYIIFGLTLQPSATLEKAAAVPFIEQMNDGLAKMRKIKLLIRKQGHFSCCCNKLLGVNLGKSFSG